MARNSVSKEAKFFCQCCGNEVPRKSRFCPSCGKFFASVLCPNCGHTGKTEDFVNGCPECGYAVDGNNGSSGGTEKTKKTDSGSQKNKSIKVGKPKALGLKNILFSQNNQKKQKSDSSLPIWIYIFSLLVLAGLVVVLYSCL